MNVQTTQLLDDPFAVSKSGSHDTTIAKDNGNDTLRHYLLKPTN